MPCALLTAYRKSKELLKLANSLNHDHRCPLIATPGTALWLRDTGLEVIAVGDLYPMPEGTDPELFKTVQPALYSDITNGRPIETAAGKQPIGFVAVDCKPLSDTFDLGSRPDVGGPVLAKVAALAVRWHNRAIAVVAGTGLDADDYSAALKVYGFGDRNAFVDLANEALDSVAGYEHDLARLVSRRRRTV